MKWLCCIALLFVAKIYAAPELLLAKEYRTQNLDGYSMSEKLDGVRAYWDGKQLLSRNGYPFTPPVGFLSDFPSWPLDGELYSGRGQFARISAAVRANEGDWSDIKFHVFDVPQAEGNLYQRLATLENWLQEHPDSNIVIIAQYPVLSQEHATRFLKRIEQAGGEGIMLRDTNEPYRGGRSSQLLKMKTAHDDECTVIAHHPGKGRHQNRLGALTCENEHGRFRIGSGFSDQEREHPPAIGSIITYRYRGFTHKGLPRFATYLRPYENNPQTDN